MTPIISLPAALLACFGLASCGGGAELTINPGAAQGITGGSAPVESAASQTARARNLAFRSDSLMYLCSILSNYYPRKSQLRRRCPLSDNILQCFNPCFEFFVQPHGYLLIQLCIFRNQEDTTCFDRKRHYAG